MSLELPIALAGHTTGLAKVLFGGLDVGGGGVLILPDLCFDVGGDSLELLTRQTEISVDHAV